jgi:hypothetical protein
LEIPPEKLSTYLKEPSKSGKVACVKVILINFLASIRKNAPALGIRGPDDVEIAMTGAQASGLL